MQDVQRKKDQNPNFNDLDLTIKPAVLKDEIKNLKKKVNRLQETNQKLNNELICIKQKINDIRVDAVNDQILKLPPKQQMVVRNCFEFAEMNPKARRYSKEWLCLCLLMRSLSARLYDRMRTWKILPLPTRITLSDHIKNIGLNYGFQESIFECLSLRASRMATCDKRGVLSADEMAIAESLYFNRTALRIEGFVNLGKITTLEQRVEKADHILLLLFQPFQGKWIQPVGIFLSKGAADKVALKSIIFEAIERLGTAGFIVDGVCTDGAQWNRGLWKSYKITVNNVSCENPFKTSASRFLQSKSATLLFFGFSAFN